MLGQMLQAHRGPIAHSYNNQNTNKEKKNNNNHNKGPAERKRAVMIWTGGENGK